MANYKVMDCYNKKKVKIHVNKYYVLQAIKERGFLEDEDFKKLKKYEKSVLVEATKKGYRIKLTGLIGGDVIMGYYKEAPKKKRGRPKVDIPLDTTKAFRCTKDEKNEINLWLEMNPDEDIRSILLEHMGINS